MKFFLLMCAIGIGLAAAIAGVVGNTPNHPADGLHLRAGVLEAQMRTTMNEMDDANFRRHRIERRLEPLRAQLFDHYRTAMELADTIAAAPLRLMILDDDVVTKDEANRRLAERMVQIAEYEAAIGELESCSREFHATISAMTAHLAGLIESRRQLIAELGVTPVLADAERLVADSLVAQHTDMSPLDRARADFHRLTVSR